MLNKSKKDTVAKQIDEEIEKQIENLDNDIEEVDEEEQKQEEEGEEGEDEHPQLDGEMTPKQQWLHIAECIERFNLILYITMTFLTPIVMFAGFSPQKRLDH